MKNTKLICRKNFKEIEIMSIKIYQTFPQLISINSLCIIEIYFDFWFGKHVEISNFVTNLIIILKDFNFVRNLWIIPFL